MADIRKQVENDLRTFRIYHQRLQINTRRGHVANFERMSNIFIRKHIRKHIRLLLYNIIRSDNITMYSATVMVLHHPRLGRQRTSLSFGRQKHRGFNLAETTKELQMRLAINTANINCCSLNFFFFHLKLNLLTLKTLKNKISILTYLNLCLAISRPTTSSGSKLLTFVQFGSKHIPIS